MGFKYTTNALLALVTISFALMINGCGSEADPLPPPPSQMKPVSPTNLRAEALTADSIRLEWTDASENEQGFEIHESIGDDTHYSYLLPVEANTLSIILPGKSPVTKYFYKMLAYNAGGTGMPRPAGNRTGLQCTNCG